MFGTANWWANNAAWDFIKTMFSTGTQTAPALRFQLVGNQNESWTNWALQLSAREIDIIVNTVGGKCDNGTNWKPGVANRQSYLIAAANI